MAGYHYRLPRLVVMAGCHGRLSWYIGCHGRLSWLMWYDWFDLAIYRSC